MTFWRNKAGRPLANAIVAGSLIYPGLVYFGRDAISPVAFVALVLVLICLRLATANSETARQWRFPLLFVALGIMTLALLDLDLAVLAYPVLMSLGVAALFGYTLFSPPSLIERFARLREPDLPPDGVSYCRKVTVVWVVFAVFNGAVAGATALWGSLELWSLWTGLISYLLMGLLFAGELAVRTRLRNR